MVTTRRNAAAPATSSQPQEQLSDTSTTTRPTRRGRKPAKKSAAESLSRKQTTTTTSAFTGKAVSTVATATTTTSASRRTRSKTTDSPLKQLGDEVNNVQKAPRRAKQQSKRKRDTPHYYIASASATPEPESVQSESVRSASVQDENDDEQGIFFTQRFDDLPMIEDVPTPPTPKAEFITGSQDALDLLHRIERSARETGEVESESQPNDTPSSQASQSVNRKRKSIDSRPASTPRAMPATNFFSRTFSAFKSRIFSSPSSAPQQQPASPTPATSNAPPADTFTEVLSAPPTPVGERSKAPPKKQKQNSMMRLLLRGVEDSDKARAEQWAKEILPTLKNDSDFFNKRKRLEKPVLLQDLKTFPSCKPWESGFGDPLGELDDEDVVPVWVVVLEMFEDDKERQIKRRKSYHQDNTMDVEDTPSLNDLFAASEGSPTSSKVRDSHGNSASIIDLHPRRSVEPSPLFDSPVSHQKGKNIFKESRGQEAAAELRESKLEALQRAATVAAPKHDPSQGSFGLDYGSDEDDSTMISETNEPADPVWTQPPPPAPTPAHAPLPAGAAAESSTSSDSASEKPVDEVERQRQKLMKHTPAKPSRLREAFVPSPSLLSDAGNESILMKTPLTAAAAVPDPFTIPYSDMPEPEDLGLDEEDMVKLRALQADPLWQAAEAANVWTDPIMIYDSDEEDLSPE